MKVYRIENVKGDGPYATPNFNWIVNDHNCLDRPSPIICSVLSKYTIAEIKPYVFGFQNLNQLNQWFCEEELQELYKLGYSIKTFNIPKKDIVLAPKQLMFKKKLI